MLLTCHSDRLRSSTSDRLEVPPFRRSTVGKRAFPVSDATAWNDLPTNVASAPSLAVFRQRLARAHHRCSPSDHFPIFTKLSISSTPLPPPTQHTFRRLHSINIDDFLSDVLSSPLITSPAETLDSLLSSYNTTLSSLLDKHAPVITKFSKRTSKSSPWFTSTLHALRSTVRRAENLYKRTHTALSWSSFKSHRLR